MTKSQQRVFGKLRNRQTNANDVSVVEASDTSITFHVAFPGLYLTYDAGGKLLESETNKEREAAGKQLATLEQHELILGGELGS